MFFRFEQLARLDDFLLRGDQLDFRRAGFRGLGQHAEDGGAARDSATSIFPSRR